VPINAAHLRSLIYREWGAYPDPKGIVEDRTATLDRLAGEVGSSMIQQRERLLDLSEQMIQSIIDEHCPPNSHAEDWDLEVLGAAVKQRFGFEPQFDAQGGLERETLAESLWSEVEKVIEARETEYPLHILLHYARVFYLEEIDERWIEHLKSMEALREGIHLRGYGQKDPKQEYKKEGFVIFGEMMDNIGRNVCEKLFHMQLQRADAPAAPPPGAAPASKPPSSVPPSAAPRARKTIESGGGAEAQARPSNGGGGGGNGGGSAEAKPVRRSEPKVGRNDPCPCGSGKKYKKCHGDVATT
jgi:preprotein translocase subunit SecA